MFVHDSERGKCARGYNNTSDSHVVGAALPQAVQVAVLPRSELLHAGGDGERVGRRRVVGDVGGDHHIAVLVGDPDVRDEVVRSALGVQGGHGTVIAADADRHGGAVDRDEGLVLRGILEAKVVERRVVGGRARSQSVDRVDDSIDTYCARSCVCLCEFVEHVWFCDMRACLSRCAHDSECVCVFVCM